jgi:hypothetical protein
MLLDARPLALGKLPVEISEQVSGDVVGGQDTPLSSVSVQPFV